MMRETAIALTRELLGIWKGRTAGAWKFGDSYCVGYLKRPVPGLEHCTGNIRIKGEGTSWADAVANLKN